MAAGDYVVKGDVFAIGVQGYTYTNIKVRDWTLTPIEEVTPITGEQKEVLSKVITNPGKKLVLMGAVLKTTAFSAIVALKKGDAVAVNSVTYMVDDVSVEGKAADVVTCTLTFVKEDSMTYTVTP